MSRFNMDEADNYGNSGGSSFFTLKDDKDTARVRFLYKGIDDVEGYAVHEVEVNGKRRYVNCLRSYNEPIDKCPFCAAQMKVIPKLFLKLYNIDEDQVQIWERGKTYFQRISSLSTRYNPLCNEVVEIERNGKKGDMKTTYEFYPIENSEFNMDDVEVTEPLGSIILDKSAEEMDEFLDTGSFPSSAEGVAQSRSEARQSNDYMNRPTGRRTPNNSNTGRRAF